MRLVYYFNRWQPKPCINDTRRKNVNFYLLYVIILDRLCFKYIIVSNIYIFV